MHLLDHANITVRYLLNNWWRWHLLLNIFTWEELLLCDIVRFEVRDWVSLRKLIAIYALHYITITFGLL